MKIRKIKTEEIETVEKIVDQRLGETYNYKIPQLVEKPNKIVKVAQKKKKQRNSRILHSTQQTKP